MSRKSGSTVDQEMEKVEKQLDAYEENIKTLTLDRMNETPKKEVEAQTKIASSDIDKSNDTYIKPYRSIRSPEKFNEKYREKYNYAKEYVNAIFENKEIIGESLDFCTKPFAGIPIEHWKVPVNKPVWVPRHVFDQICKCYYHRLKTEDRVVSNDGMGSYTGQMVVDTTVQRLDANPVSSKRHFSMNTRRFE